MVSVIHSQQVFFLVNLESAVQFVNLIAAYHLDVTTRDRSHNDIHQLIDRVMIVISNRLEELSYW